MITTVLLSGIASAQDGSFYKGPAVFSTRPSETKSLQNIKRFGPVGMGIDLLQLAFVMRISHVEEGYRYAGRGNNPYGDNRPFTGFVDNGKNGKLAFAMAAAAALTPDGEDSVYARARDVCAMQSFYTTTFMLHGHTGGGIGEIWRALAANEVQSERAGGTRDPIDGLAALYKRAGQDEFAWHMFADLRNTEWSYHSFDPTRSPSSIRRRRPAMYATRPSPRSRSRTAAEPPIRLGSGPAIP